MSYPTAAEIIDLTRALILADAPGSELIYTNTRIMSSLGIAWREMWDALIAFGAARPRATFYHLLPAYTGAFYPSKFGVVGIADVVKVEEDSVGGSFDIISLQMGDDGSIVVSTGSPHGLASNGRVVIANANRETDGDWFVTVVDPSTLKLNGSEYRTGLSSVNARLIVPASASMTGFVPVAPVTMWTRRAPAPTLREYQWEADRFKFHGATADRLLSIAAVLSAPALPVAETDALTVDNCHNFLAYRTAALVAGAQGRDDLFTRYSVMALGPNQKPDGSGGYLAGLTAVAARSAQRNQTQRPTP